jgi:hypothetical protein
MMKHLNKLTCTRRLLLPAIEGQVPAGCLEPPPAARHQALQLHLLHHHSHNHQQLHSQGHLQVNKPRSCEHHKLTGGIRAAANTSASVARSPAAALTTMLNAHHRVVAPAAEVSSADAESYLADAASAVMQLRSFLATQPLPQLHTCKLA